MKFLKNIHKYNECHEASCNNKEMLSASLFVLECSLLQKQYYFQVKDKRTYVDSYEGRLPHRLFEHQDGSLIQKIWRLTWKIEAPYGVLQAFSRLSFPVETNHLPEAANLRDKTQLSWRCSWYLSGLET